MTDFQAIDGQNNLQPVASLPDDNGSFILIRSSEHRKNTYRYAGNFTPVATPTDVLMIKGSASMTLRVKRIALGGLATTAGSMPVTLIRRSTQFTTQGTAALTAVTPAVHDITNDGAATGVVSTIGTANYTTVGATAGNVGQGRLWLPLVTAQPAPLVWEFATRQDKAVLLRGVSDFLYINLGGAAVPAGGTIDYEIEIEEDAS